MHTKLNVFRFILRPTIDQNWVMFSDWHIRMTFTFLWAIIHCQEWADSWQMSKDGVSWCYTLKVCYESARYIWKVTCMLSSLRRSRSESNVQYMKSTWNGPLMTTGWQQILLVVVIFSYSKNIWLNNELQTSPLLGVLTYFFGYEPSLLLSLYVFLLTSKIFK